MRVLVAVTLVCAACGGDVDDPQERTDRPVKNDGVTDKDCSTQAANKPSTLSATRCVAMGDPLSPIDGFVPYDVNMPLWTDGAEKTRAMFVPDGKSITVLEDGDLELPVGSVLVKHFAREGRLIETRLLARAYPVGEMQGWVGSSYRWNEAQTEARIVSEDEVVDLPGGRQWQFPGKSCAECHRSANNTLLGPSLMQLDRSFPYDGGEENQLTHLVALGLLEEEDAADVEAFPTMEEAADDPVRGARAYMHVNCSHCHRPGGHTCPRTDLRYSTPLELTKLCNPPGNSNDRVIRQALGSPEALVFWPGEPGKSLLFLRTQTRGPHKMPMLGSLEVHDEGSQLIANFITESLCPLHLNWQVEPPLQGTHCEAGATHCPNGQQQCPAPSSTKPPRCGTQTGSGQSHCPVPPKR